MKILVSACLIGENCKYNGKSNLDPNVVEFLKGKEFIAVCPEISAGLGAPRASSEIVNGVVYDKYGNNVDAEYRRGTEKVLSEIAGEDVGLCILYPQSPTCGVNRVYDGSFTGRMIPGTGVFAAALKAKGYRLVASDELDSAR